MAPTTASPVPATASFPSQIEMLAKRARASERARWHHLTKQLQTRLQYARLKVEHGWSKQTLNEVENLYFHHHRSRQPSAVSLAAAEARAESAKVSETQADKQKEREQQLAAVAMLGLSPEILASLQAVGVANPKAGALSAATTVAYNISMFPSASVGGVTQSAPRQATRSSPGGRDPGMSSPTPSPIRPASRPAFPSNSSASTPQALPSSLGSAAPVPLPSRTPLFSYSATKPNALPSFSSGSTPSYKQRYGISSFSPSANRSTTPHSSQSNFSMSNYSGMSGSPLQSRSQGPQPLTYDSFWSNHTSAALTAASLREKARKAVEAASTSTSSLSGKSSGPSGTGLVGLGIGLTGDPQKGGGK